MGVLISMSVWLLTGAMVGILFALIMGTGERGGFWEYIGLGIVGAFISGILFRAIGGNVFESWQVAIITGIFGAIVLMVMAEYAHRLGQDNTRDDHGRRN